MSVATAGDVNGDGYADVVVGAPGYSSDTGRAYVYLGGASGLATTAATTLTGEATNELLRLLGGDGGGCERGRLRRRGGRGAWLQQRHRAGVRVSGWGERPGDDGGDDADGRGDGNYFGYSVATAGDVNGDGYADVVVGAQGYSSDHRAGVRVSGRGERPGDDGGDDADGRGGEQRFGISVATAGDVNGDGYADVVIGASGYDSYTGRAYVYLGGASGLATTAATTLTGEAASERFGSSVATAGDVNGDGYADVVVGAHGYSS